MNMEIVYNEYGNSRQHFNLQHAMDEYAFSFINVNNGELLSQVGATGEGPEVVYRFLGSGF